MKIRDHLQAKGCRITGGGSGLDSHHTELPQIGASDIDGHSVYYSLQGSEGRVEVYVIGRDYERDNKKVVGQLLITVHEGR